MSAFVGDMLSMVTPAEAAFRSRWRLSTLLRLDAELHEALVDQIGLFDASLVKGSEREAREHAQAMVRGWQAACARMEAPLQDDDAYFLGIDYNTGLHVVVGEHLASKSRVRVGDGQRVIFMTPDEVARLVAGSRMITDAKHVFPDAELLGLSVGGVG